MSQVGFCRFLELTEDLRGDLWRRIGLPVDFNFDVLVRSADDLVGNDLFFRFDFVVATSHESFDRVNRVLGVGHGLALGGITNQSIAFFGKRDHAGGDAIPFLVRDDFDFATFHDRHDGIRRTQVDADDSFLNSHVAVPCWSM
jgi:hypothetical protein